MSLFSSGQNIEEYCTDVLTTLLVDNKTNFLMIKSMIKNTKVKAVIGTSFRWEDNVEETSKHTLDKAERIAIAYANKWAYSIDPDGPYVATLLTAALTYKETVS